MSTWPLCAFVFMILRCFFTLREAFFPSLRVAPVHLCSSFSLSLSLALSLSLSLSIPPSFSPFALPCCLSLSCVSSSFLSLFPFPLFFLSLRPLSFRCSLPLSLYLFLFALPPFSAAHFLFVSLRLSSFTRSSRSPPSSYRAPFPALSVCSLLSVLQQFFLSVSLVFLSVHLGMSPP